MLCEVTRRLRHMRQVLYLQGRANTRTRCASVTFFGVAPLISPLRLVSRRLLEHARAPPALWDALPNTRVRFLTPRWLPRPSPAADTRVQACFVPAHTAVP